MNGTQRRALVNPCIALYSGMAKGTSQAEVTSNNEKIKPVALAIVTSVRKALSQAVSQSVENSVA